MSRLLVIIQFTSLTVIAMTGALPATLPSVFLTAGGGALGLWAIVVMQWDNLRIFPEPKKDIRFVTAGPYAVIRHPMYTALLLASAGFLPEASSPIPFIAFGTLSAALLGKISIEERLLPSVLPDYPAYQRRTKKLIPYIF